MTTVTTISADELREVRDVAHREVSPCYGEQLDRVVSIADYALADYALPASPQGSSPAGAGQ